MASIFPVTRDDDRWIEAQLHEYIGRELMARIREGCEIYTRRKPDEQKFWLTMSQSETPLRDLRAACEGPMAGSNCLDLNKPGAEFRVLEGLRSFAPESTD